MILVILTSVTYCCDYVFESSNVPYISHQVFMPGSTVCIDAKLPYTAVVFNNWEDIPAKVVLDNGTELSIASGSKTTGFYFGKHNAVIRLFLPLFETSLSFGIFSFPESCQQMYVTNNKKETILLREQCGEEGCFETSSSMCLFSAAMGSVKYSIDVNTDNSNNNLTIYYSGKKDSFSGILSSELDLPENSQVYLRWNSNLNNPSKYVKLSINAPLQQVSYKVSRFLTKDEFIILTGKIQVQYSSVNIVVLTIGTIVLVAVGSTALYIVFSGGRSCGFCGYHCVRTTNTLPDGGVEERPIQIAPIEATGVIDNEEAPQNIENDPYSESLTDGENPYAV